jgi:SAM-dependent methyltransferase
MTDRIVTDRPASHYDGTYQSEGRWLSYVRQLSLAKDLAPGRVLEVGVGPGSLRAIFAIAHSDCEFVGLDIRTDLSTDVCGDVRHLPFADRAFDVVYCCQVLEHLPYESFVEALTELRRVTAKRLVLSLPDDGLFFYARIRGLRRILPWLWDGFSLPNLRPATIDVREHGQHFWEVGRRGYPAARIRRDADHPEFRRAQEFRMVERPYWHFYVYDRLTQ